MSIGCAPVDAAADSGAAADRAAVPLVSVVIPTIGRSAVLGDALDSVRESHHPRLEVVVVVNGDGERASRVTAEHTPIGNRVKFVREPRLGAARARNTGARHASGSVLLFVDDDVTLDPHTVCHAVDTLVRVSGAGCVTGRILPMSIESDAQRLLEEYGGYDKGPDPRRFSARDFERGGVLYPFLPGRLGSGAAVALTRQVFDQLGGFDERLGPGTPARGAEDLDLLVRVLKAGHEVHYVPSAVVRHLHRSELDALSGQLRSYGVGMGSLVTKQVTADPASALRMLVRIPAGAHYTLSPRSAKNARKTAYPWQLTASELAGLLLGPLAYARSCLRSRHIDRTSVHGSPAGAGKQAVR